LLGDREAEYALDCIRSGWISSEGEYVHRFEDAWSSYCGARSGVAVSSGTAALFAAVAALGLGPGDEVIMPTFTIISCAHAILAAGATPVLVDSEPRTWCMDVGLVAERITPRTRAIMVVHTYGHPADVAPLREICRRHSLALIEDAAEAHGAEYHGARAGSLGDIACFSFYANKIVTTGEGGMVVTNDEALEERVRSYINLAFRRDRRFYHTERGYNFRLTSLQAAVGLAQLESIEWRIARKRQIGQRYVELLADIEELALPVEMPGVRNVYWMVGLVLDSSSGIDAAELARRLGERGVATRPFFLGMHEQPVLQELGLFGGESYPVAERLSRYGLYLPSGLTLSDDEVELAAARVREALRR
jgi:perosamine synthetase